MAEEVRLPSIPVKIIKDGKEVDTSAIDDYDSFMNFLMLASIAHQQIRIRREIEEHNRKESFEGRLDSRTLDATDKSQRLWLMEEWPFTPWISAFFINRGPDAVYIRINSSEEIRIEAHETRTIDHIHADERIEWVYYKCNEGETASVTIEGHY